MKKFLISLILCVPILVHAAITAKSYVVMDLDDGSIIAEQNADEKRPIASITKLITASRNTDLPPDDLITITAEDMRDGKMRSTPLRVGHSYARSVLMELALVNSDNVAAIALGRTSPIAATIRPNTTYVEASGLDPENQSTARELAELGRSLYNTSIASTSVHPSVVVEGRVRPSTNPLLRADGWEFYLSKTGFINASGGCLLVITKIKDKLAVVAILGSADTRQRWRDLAELRAELGDTGFQWPFWKAIKQKFKRKKK